MLVVAAASHDLTAVLADEATLFPELYYPGRILMAEHQVVSLIKVLSQQAFTRLRVAL